MTLFNKLLITVLLLAQGVILRAQPQIILLQDKSTLKIEGTSSLHDWEEIVEQFSVDLSFKTNGNSINGIDRISFSCKSASITSESSLMNNKTHDALKTDKYDKITFSMLKTEKFSMTNGKLSGIVTGNIFLSGVTRQITVAFDGQITGSTITIKGSKILNMTDYNIKPPTAILGTLKTGEEVTIGFELQFQMNEVMAANFKY